MAEVAILLTEQHRLLSVAAILDVFETVNRLYQEKYSKQLFNIRLAGTTPSVVGYGKYVAEPIEGSLQYDLVLVPAFNDSAFPAALADTNAISWLQRQYKHGAELGSFCSGAFLLAASGLLDDRPATTHINAAPFFEKLFPKVNLKADAVVTHKDGLFTSGGATNSFHLLLMLAEKYANREIAVQTAKIFAIDMNRVQQTYFKSSPVFPQHVDDLVKQAETEIRNSFSTGKNIEELTRDIPASRRNLVRRFKKATGITPIEYLQKLRIETAKSLLEATASNIQEIMIHSGYNDLKTFRLLFKKSVGISPKEYRDKFKGQQLMYVS